MRKTTEAPRSIAETTPVLFSRLLLAVDGRQAEEREPKRNADAEGKGPSPRPSLRHCGNLPTRPLRQDRPRTAPVRMVPNSTGMDARQGDHSRSDRRRSPQLGSPRQLSREPRPQLPGLQQPSNEEPRPAKNLRRGTRHDDWRQPHPCGRAHVRNVWNTVPRNPGRYQERTRPLLLPVVRLYGTPRPTALFQARRGVEGSSGLGLPDLYGPAVWQPVAAWT